MSDKLSPDIEKFEAPEGCMPFDTPFGSHISRSFVDGDPESSRLRMKMFVRETDRRLFSKVWWGPNAEGPPNHAHGGSTAAVLDHMMGTTCWAEGYPVVSATITIDFIRGLPLIELYTVETWVEKIEGNKIYAQGRIYLDDDEKPFVTGHGLFIKIPAEKLERMVEIVNRP